MEQNTANTQVSLSNTCASAPDQAWVILANNDKNDMEHYSAVWDLSFYKTRSILKISFAYCLMDKFENFKIWLKWP